MRKLIVMLTLGVIAPLGLAYTPAEATGPKVDCTESNDCTSETADDGAACAWDDDGDEATPMLTGHLDNGYCVCDEVLPTTTSTSTTEPPTTSTTVAETTTSTTVEEPPTTEPPTTVIPTTEPPTTTAPTLLPLDDQPSDANLFANCDEAIAAGHANLVEGEVGYRPGLDSDGDGVACETDAPEFVAQPTASGQLPHTGSNLGPMLATGASLVGVARRRARTA